MKTKVKNIVMLLVVVIAAYTAYAAFYYNINSFVFYVTNWQPVKWKNISFNYSIGMKFIISEQWIQIFYYGREKEGSVLIELCDLFDNNDDIIDFMRKRNDSYIMTSHQETLLNGMPVLNVNAIDKETGYFLDAYYIIDKGFIVSFYGSKDRQGDYKDTLGSIVVGNQ